ncbi:MAG: SDR family NAD(P)-dependent oxidoreductase [Actinomycetota bacterium]|jgi:NADP-dependent 3-hydroxy acid dehydrogenase YdfG|nr:SDR family NAD(P)-dependent oxidoreductase [Euzebyaceae bacterium]MDQ3529448.1 SDR family NAD(P)-dependent oxidoreductase [Actinomycetota bacterium]
MLVDATVLVTGASSGIGRACAEAFARAGARLLLCARRGDRLTELADSLDAEVRTLPLDVRDRAAVSAAVDGLDDGWRNVDVLVNNAGLAVGFGPLQDNDPADWDRMIDTNITGLLNVTHAVVPAMVRRGRGHVINIGSIAGRQTYPNGAVYCATKAAVDRITTGLRMDLLGKGVRVSTVDPGAVETEFSVVRFSGDHDRAERVYEGMRPLTADDVAETVVWVADRPAHVQVAEVVLLPTDQAAATQIARRRS